MVYSYSRILLTIHRTCLSISPMDSPRTLFIFFNTDYPLSIDDIDHCTTFTSYWSTKKTIQIFFTNTDGIFFNEFIEESTELSNTTNIQFLDPYYGLNRLITIHLFPINIRAFSVYDNEYQWRNQASNWTFFSIDWRDFFSLLGR
jgi:hypothetical protein